METDEDVAIILPDIRLGRSLGAKWINYDIEMPDGSILNLTEGTIIRMVEWIGMISTIFCQTGQKKK